MSTRETPPEGVTMSEEWERVSFEEYSAAYAAGDWCIHMTYTDGMTVRHCYFRRRIPDPALQAEQEATNE